MEAYLDVCNVRCPSCNSYYAEASWFAIELGSDMECGKCKVLFNAAQNVCDRLTLRFSIEDGKVTKVEI